MNTLYMQIHSYEESSGSLIVSFASDETQSQNPEDYPAYAFQPLHMWPDVTDLDEIKKRIAVAGMYHAEQQAREEAFKVDEMRIAQLKNLAGQLRSYAISDLAPPAPPTLELTQTIPSVEV
jgi:hypothetical protein